MPTNEQLNIILRLRDKATKEFQKIGQSIKQRAKSMLEGIRKHWLAVAAAIVAATLAIRKFLQFTAKFVQAASTAEQYQVRLNALLGTVEKGNLLFQEMAEFAGTVSFEFEEIMGSATALAGVMEGGVEEIKRWMPIIADLAAVSGLGIQQTTTQIIRMYSAGAAAADLFRERGILQMLGFQAGVSVSIKDTRDTIIKAWEDANSKFRDASQDLAKTWEGLLSMMSDRWFIFRNKVMAAGFFDIIKNDVTKLLEEITKLTESGKLDEMAIRLSKAFANTLNTAKITLQIVARIIYGWVMIKQGLELFFNRFMQIMAIASEKVLEFFKFFLDKMAIVFEKIPRFGKKIAEELKKASAVLDEAKAKTEFFADSFKNLGDESGQSLEGVAADLESILDILKTKAPEIAKETTEKLKETFEEYRKSETELWIEHWDKQSEIVKEGLDYQKALRSQTSLEEFLIAQQFLEERKSLIDIYIEQWKIAHETIGHFAVRLFAQMSKGISKAFTDIIFRVKSAKEAFKALGEQMIKMIVEFMVQKVVAMAMSKVMQLLITKIVKKSMESIAASAAPAAAMVSLASYGANAAPAMAGIAATVGMAQALAIPQMAEGGVIKRPTLVLAGEKGEEAIVPLNEGVMSPINIYYTHYGDIRDDRDIRLIAEEIGFLTERESTRPR